MLGTKWKHLGFVTIDTASLLLVDPMHVETMEAPPDGQIDLPGGDYSAVVVPTGMGDGRYSVEGRYADCLFGRRLAEVRILFLDEHGDWLGADPKEPPQKDDMKLDLGQEPTTGNVTEVVAVDSLDDMLKLATGEANQEAPHLTVPFYMPLALPMSFEEALTCISPSLRKKAKSGAISLVAVANGQMAPPGDEPTPVQIVLFFDADEDAPGYYLFDTINGEVDTAVLIRGDGSCHLESRPLPSTEAVALWMGGFLGWSEKVPGLYRLRYAMIEKVVTDSASGETATTLE